MRQITVITPLSLLAAANQWMRAAAYGPEDGNTFTSPTHTDAEGAEYAMAAGPLRNSALARMAAEPAMPVWGADLVLAREAFDALGWVDPPIEPEAEVVYDLGKVLVIEGATMQSAAAALGLTLIPPPPEPDPDAE